MQLVSARDLTHEVVAAFTGRFGAPPTVAGRAPGRVNLVGEHTDYNGGLCLPVALRHAAYTAVRLRDDDRIRVGSGQTGSWSGTLGGLAPGDRGDAAYVVGALWALREAGHLHSGLDLYLDSEVPIGSGLSSSAAVICATVVAFGTSTRGSLPELTEVAIRAETEGVGAPTGGLDQTVSFHGDLDTALLLDFSAAADQDDRVADRVRWSPVAAGLGLLVVDTRVQHSHSGGGYGDRRAESEAAAAALGVGLLGEASAEAADGLDDPVLRRRARHVVTETERVRRVVAAVRAGDWSLVGELFIASHASLRDDYEVSCPELDSVVEASLAAGALGARMTGGGFGGSAIVLAEAALLPRIADAVTAAAAAIDAPRPAFLDGRAGGGASVTDLTRRD